MMYSKRYLPDIAVEPEQWLQRHPEAGSSWPSWPEASYPFQAANYAHQLVTEKINNPGGPGGQ